ncbi:MAG: hypothetical protein EA390_07525, partial [Balneolaceae bacterium]
PPMDRKPTRRDLGFVLRSRSELFREFTALIFPHWDAYGMVLLHQGKSTESIRFINQSYDLKI